MRYANEFKVGVAIVVSVLILILGIRYFQDLPIFGGGRTIYTVFEDAEGLLSGNPVLMNGVNIGLVEAVGLDSATHRVRVQLLIDEEITVPQGSIARISGFGALGGVRVDIEPGPPGSPPLADGATIPSDQGLFSELSARAEPLLGRADTLLLDLGVAARGAAGAFDQADLLLRGSSGDVQATLLSLRRTSATLEAVLLTEREKLSRTLTEFEQLAASLNAATGPSGDSLQAALSSLNRSLARMDRNLAELSSLTTTLDTLAVKIDRGDGTLGRLVNDASLYNNLDSASVNLNRLLTDFIQNPERYLRHLRLVDVF